MESGISNPDQLNQSAPGQAREVLVSNLGALIRQERQKRGLTLAQACERAHISSAFLSLVERGKAMPSWEVSLALRRLWACRFRLSFRWA